MSTFRDLWVYEQQDPMLVLFDHAVTRWGFDLPDGSRILELGCRETDWAQRIKKATKDCTVVGIDPLGCPDYGGDYFVQGDAADPNLFEQPWLQRGSFDAVISLGAIEHFGLGYYGDPVGERKDTEAIRNAWHWLKPGGSLYFDVPWTPGDAHQTPHYRVYSDATMRDRLLDPGFIWLARGWAPNTKERDAFTEVRPMLDYKPFYFFAQWGVKA
jgi:SAM-dependent methyltransferase